MSRAFADISFTDSVKAAQSLYGSREANRGFEQVEEKRDYLLDKDIEFIAARDSFYQATISENGWPYVQHRGGPAGFLRVLDEKTIGYADFSGNAQYLSVGNLFASDRISLILMDYANRRRLKIWGRAKIVHEIDNPKLIAQLEMGSYRAQVERAVVITVEAVEWNCPQHITPRFTEKEVQFFLSQLQEENRTLQEKLTLVDIKTTALRPARIGFGALELVVSGVRQLSSLVRAFELRDPDGKELPKVSAGAHLRVPVLFANGQSETRQYSICSNPVRHDIYEIAVMLEENGNGGSKAAHQFFEVGVRLFCDMPRNDFALEEGDAPVVLIAGGIGITPIKGMAQTLHAKNKSFTLHYAAKRYDDMPYRDRLQREFGTAMQVYAGDQARRLDIMQILSTAAPGAMFYICGPSRLIDAINVQAKALNIAPQRIRFERFSALKSDQDKTIRVELRKSRKVIEVKPEESVLQAVRAAGVDTAAECEVGNCGTCTTRVLGGQVEHRDSVLSDAEKQHSMCICVSRASSSELILDI